MTEIDIKNMTFKELIVTIKKFDNCCVDAKHMIVRDLKHWASAQQNYVDNLIINNKNPKEDKTANFKKRCCQDVLFALQNEENIYPAGTLPPPKFGSIYPLQD